MEYFFPAHPGNIPQHLLLLSVGASCQWEADLPHPEVSSLPLPRCPGLSTLLMPHFCASTHPLSTVVQWSWPPSALQPSYIILAGHRGKKQLTGVAPTSPWGAGGKDPNPGWRGWGGLLVYFSFSLRLSSEPVFISPYGSIDFPACHPRPVPPKPGRWAGSKRRGWDPVLRG